MNPVPGLTRDLLLSGEGAPDQVRGGVYLTASIGPSARPWMN